MRNGMRRDKCVRRSDICDVRRAVRAVRRCRKCAFTVRYFVGLVKMRAAQ
jgi:hypothetical protein